VIGGWALLTVTEMESPTVRPGPRRRGSVFACLVPPRRRESFVNRL
jgi:hypothetical protein